LLFPGMEKQLWRPPGGAGVEVEWPLIPSCQKKKKKRVGEKSRRGTAAKRRGKGANFIPTAANRQTAAALSFSGTRRFWVPFAQFLLPSSAAPLPPPPRVPPPLPAPLWARVPRVPLGAAGEKTRETEANPGDKLRERTCWKRRPKVAHS
jgi:hypothetical protein